jgi:hypothetical protein
MENRQPFDLLTEAKTRLGIDEDLFYALFYDCLTVESMPTAEKIIRYLESFMSKDFDGNIAKWRKEFHALALAQLETDIAALGLPVKKTAHEMARREFGVDDARWLRCWQLAKLAYLLKMKGAK